MKTKNNAMKNISRGLVSALALTLVFVSCEQISEDINPAGMISFGAAASYVNAPETKTEYSGKDQNDAVISSTSQFERIDWVKDYDIIKILCGQTKNEDGSAANTSGTYKITAVPTADGKVSKESAAGVTPVDGTTPFFWGTGDHYFYALYPAAGTKSNYHEGTVADSDSKIELLDADGTKAKITGSVPAEQAVVKSGNIYKPNMNRAYMYAAKKTAPSSETVTLDFYPLVTAFEFYLKALDHAMAIADLTTLTLTSTSTDMTGGFTATLDLNAETPATITKASSGLGREITVTFPDNTRLAEDEYLDVTVLALGVAQTDLRLTLTFADNTTRSIDLKKKVDDTGNLEAVSVGACKKVYMRLGMPVGPIFEVTPVVTFDWEGNRVDPNTGEILDPTTTEPASVTSKTIYEEGLPWTIEGYYTDEACTVPVPDDQLDPVTGIPIWLASLNEGHPGGPGSQPFPIDCPMQDIDVTETLTDEAMTENDKVRVVADKGTATAPWNVSNPTGDAFIVESANSYIVNGPGYYRLPLVMGNGIKNDALNPDEITYKGYDGNKRYDWRALFEDYKGGYVTDPRLHRSSTGAGTPTYAYIVWEDVEGLIETNTNGDYYLPNAISLEPSGAAGVYWLNFHVARERSGNGIADVTNVPDNRGGANGPRQGNAVIAIQDQNHITMWSYHIWLTDCKSGADKNLFSDFYKQINDVDGSEKVRIDYAYELMSRYLGWVVYGQTIDATDYPANSVYVNFVQTGTGLTDVMQINQTGHSLPEIRRNRSHPVWQHGRSTPQWSPYGFDSTEPVWYGRFPEYKEQEAPVSIGEALQHPEIGYKVPASSSQYLVNHIFANTNIITSPHDWYVTYYDGSSFLISENQNLVPAAPPTNLWNALSTFSAGSLGGKLFAYHFYYAPGETHYKDDAIWINPSWGRTVKTIYDPCPPGYKIPSQNVISYQVYPSEYNHHSEFGFIPRGVNVESQDNPMVSLYTSPEKNNTVNYPLGFTRNAQSVLNRTPAVLFFVSEVMSGSNGSQYTTSSRIQVINATTCTSSYTYCGPVIPLFEATAPNETVFPEFIGNYDAPLDEKFPYYYPPRP